MNRKKITLVLTLFIFCLLTVYSQSKGIFKSSKSDDLEGMVLIKGRVFYSGIPLDGANIDIVKGDKVIGTYLSDDVGKYNIPLPLQEKYKLKFSQQGKVPKYILVDTHTKDSITGYWEVAYYADLYDSLKGVDFKVLDDPNVKVAYNLKEEKFSIDWNYDLHMQKKFAMLQHEYDSINSLMVQKYYQDFLRSIKDGYQGLVVIKGKITEGKKRMDGVVVQVFKGNEVVGNTVTNFRGRYRTQLALESFYKVKFSQFGKVSKYITVDTHIKDSLSGLWEIEIDLSLFDKIKGLDEEVLSNPVAKVIYDDKTNNLVIDREYEKMIRPQLDKLQSQYDILNSKLD